MRPEGLWPIPAVSGKSSRRLSGHFCGQSAANYRGSTQRKTKDKKRQIRFSRFFLDLSTFFWGGFCIRTRPPKPAIKIYLVGVISLVRPPILLTYHFIGEIVIFPCFVFRGLMAHSSSFGKGFQKTFWTVLFRVFWLINGG